MDLDWIVPYREALPWSTRAGHALAALAGGALYTRAVVSRRVLPHQQPSSPPAGRPQWWRTETAALCLDLLLLSPVLVLNTLLPFWFDANGDELLSRLALSFMATWLGSFKAIGAALGRGPLAQAPWTPAQYALLYAAPVYPSAGCTGGTVPAPKASSASGPPAAQGGSGSPAAVVQAGGRLRGGRTPLSPSLMSSPSTLAAKVAARVRRQQQHPASPDQPLADADAEDKQAGASGERLQGRLADDAGSLPELLLALVGNASVLAACAYVLVAYDIPPWPRSYVYALGLYGFVCVLMGVPAAMIRGGLGVTLVPPFDKPWLCHSVADYWGRRWNNTTSLHLRSLVYDIVVDGRWVRVGGHAAAAATAAEAAVGGGVAAGGGAGGAAAGNGGNANVSGAADGGGVSVRRLGSAGGLLDRYLSTANLAELVAAGAAGSRPGTPDRAAGAGGRQTAVAPAPATTPAANTRSRARAAATATVTLSSFDLGKKYPASSSRLAAGESAFSGSASPSPVRGGGSGPAVVALAPAPPPSQLRRDLGVFTAFFVSAIFHEIILCLVVPNAALGWWFGFFVLQAPLMVAERTALRALRRRNIELPTLLRRAFTTALLLSVSRVFFFTPIEVKSDLAQRVAEAVAGNFSALGRGVVALQRSVASAAVF